MPLVSIILFCRNSAGGIRRAVESVLRSTYRDFELVVQDGQSTDGTIEILRGFGDPRIKLVSEPDSGSSDAFRKALARCTGAIIGSCLADEELFPDAIEEAVRFFAAHPDIGALTGDAVTTDAAGNETGVTRGAAFDLLDYLLGRRTPYFCASFFTRRALEEIGFFADEIQYDCFEFELWCRLGMRDRVAYLPKAIAKYAIHEGQLSNTPRAMMRHIDGRLAVLDRMFSEDGFFGNNPALRDRIILAQLKMFYAHAVAYGLDAIIAALEPRIGALSSGAGAQFAETWLAQQKARRVWLGFGNLFPPEVKRWILGKGLHLYVRPWFLAAARLAQGRAAPESQRSGATLEERAELALCHETALLFHARGQIEEALALWRRAEALDDVEIDSLACQAAQRAPAFAAPDILAMQQRWAKRHADYPAIAPRPLPALPAQGQPIRVGYHCAWWDSPVARHQLLNFIRHHDRAKVAPYCYSPIPVPQEIARLFAELRVTGRLSDADFAALARADALDVMVETTGFSPHHRYSAMARRCAPVQISYLNHHATTAVPNLDYVLGDAVVAEGPDRRFFTETIYPLPGCFFCFDLRGTEFPLRAEPPCLSKGFVTFGCFGTGSKLNLRLIELWAAILDRVPDARLLLRNRDLTPRDNRRLIERRFARFGIDPDRLLLMEGADHAAIMRNYAEIDVSLDTWPYCGGNTIAESFWQGVPVVTLLGDRFSARYGASLVRAHGCPELVAESREHYVEIAAALAADRTRLAAYRRDLRGLATQDGFNDSQGFARKLEAAFAEMLSRLR